MAIRVAINGFGRIGRNILRLTWENKEFEFVGINDLTDPNTLAHLLKYDSIFGVLDTNVKAEGNTLHVGSRSIPVTSERDPSALPWKKQEVDVVLECTGIFTNRAGADAHLKAGARKVLLSAPAKPSNDADLTCVYGVNHKEYVAEKHNFISNASCTTNCLAPIAKVLHENFKIESGFMTTIHSYTNDQQLMDSPHKDLRRARAAAISQIPTTTGAAKAVGLVLPELKGKLDGIAMRVPTPNVSCLDLVAVVGKQTSAEEVNAALLKAANGELKGILRYCDEPLVSVDFLGETHSSILDAQTTAVHNNLVKVLAWYDNEAGFSNRMIDMARLVGKQ